MDSIGRIKKLFKLKLHPMEGGYFAETYHAKGRIPNGHAYSTAIYYLFTPESVSLMHRIKSDEIFHFYLGDPVEMLNLYADGKGKTLVLGNKVLEGMTPQVIVPKGIWQGGCLRKGGRFALIGTTVAPGFEYRDYEHGRRACLTKKYPEFKKQIEKLTTPE